MPDDAASDEQESEFSSSIENELQSLNANILNLAGRGEFEEALEDALSLRDRIFSMFGERPPMFSMILNTLATIAFSQGQFEHAGVYSREAARLEREDDNGDTYRYFNMLMMVAESYRAVGDFDLALTTANEAYDVSQQISSEDSLDFGMVLTVLAGAHFDLGKYDIARRSIEQAIEVLSQHLNSNPDSVGRLLASAKNLLGLCLREQKHPMEAMGPLNDAMEWGSSNLGKEHPLTAEYRANLSAAFIDIKEYSTARKALVTSATSLRDAIGPCSQLVVVLNNLGVVMLHEGRIDEADDVFQEAVWCIQEADGIPEHINTLVWHNVAVLLQTMGNIEEAIQQLEPMLDRMHGHRRDIAEMNLQRMQEGSLEGMPIAV